MILHHRVTPKCVVKVVCVSLHSIIFPLSLLTVTGPMASPEWDVKLWPVRAARAEERRELPGARPGQPCSLLTGLSSALSRLVTCALTTISMHQALCSFKFSSNILIANIHWFFTCCANTLYFIFTHIVYLTKINCQITWIDSVDICFPGWSLSIRFTCQPFVHNLGIEQKQAPAAWAVCLAVCGSVTISVLTPRVWHQAGFHNHLLPIWNAFLSRS